MEQAAKFWHDLAGSLARHPALVGVNVLNEPRPKRPDQLTEFHRRMLLAVRSADTRLPVILDAAPDAEPSGFHTLMPVDDNRVLYSVHVYEPWSFITWRKNRGRHPYPGADASGVLVDRKHLARVLEPVRRWQKRHGIPSRRILVGEFGIDRRIPGAADYLADLIDLFEGHGWHWAFYAFREDSWNGMNHELGPSPAFTVIRKGLSRNRLRSP
jgi:hypothetical protein